MKIKPEILQLKLFPSTNFEFEVREGEGLSIIGENGSGKSKLLSRIFLRKKGVGFMGNRNRLSKEEKMLWQVDVDYFDGTTKNLVDQRVVDVIDKVSAKFSILPKEIAKMLDISENDYEKKIKKVSGKLEVVVAFLYALARDSKLLFIDDVFGLNGEIKSAILPLLERARDEFNLTYVIATTDPNVAKRLTSYVLIIEDGKPVEYGRCDTIFKKPLHPYSKWFVGSNKKKKDVVFIRTEMDEKPPKRACRFCVVCPLADDTCKSKACEFELHGRDHFTACHKV